MQKIWIATTCALLVGCSNAPETKTAQRQLKLSGVEAAVQPLLTEAPNAPALVVGVWNAGHEEYFAFHTMGPKADETTVFRIGSLTKPLTATLAATYVSDNTIAYDTAVNSGPCGKDKTSAFCFRGETTTYGNLIQHTSNLPQQPANFESSATYEEAQLQDFLSGFELAAAPGHTMLYSSTGYYALNMIMERRTGSSVPDGMIRRVARPLDMGNTSFAPKELIQGYADGAKTRDSERTALTQGSGGLASTATDLMKFMKANMNPEATGGLGKSIELTQRVSPAIKAFGTSFAAHGWFQLQDSDIYWHAGTATGHHGFMAFDRRNQKAVVILTNTAVPEGDTRAAIAAFQMLADPTVGVPKPKPTEAE